jgi:multiple sugar transport system substrate-binding protein
MQNKNGLNTKRVRRRTLMKGGLALSTMAVGGIMPAFAQSTVKLWTFIDPADSSVRAKTLAHVLSEFQKANPDITVEPTVIQWDQIPQILLRAQMTGDVPDVVMIYSPSFKAMIAAEALAPLDTYIGQMPASDQADMITLPVGRSKGMTYGLPWELRVIGLAYNNKVLREAGFKRPEDLTELATTTAELTKNHNITGLALGFNPSDPAAGMEWCTSTVAGFGGKFINDDGTGAFNSKPWVDVANYVHDLVHKYKSIPVDVVLSGDAATQQMIEANRAAFCPTGTHVISLLREKTQLGNDLTWMPMPGGKKGDWSPALVEGWNLAIPAKAENKDAAWKLIEHWTSPAMQLYQCQAAAYMPMRVSVTKNQVLQGDDKAFLREAIAYAQQKPLDIVWPENTDILFNVVSSALEDIILDKQKPEDALAAAVANYNSNRG